MSIFSHCNIKWPLQLIIFWIVSVVIYASFIPLMVEKEIFASDLSIMAIFCTITFVPLVVLNYLSRNKNKENNKNETGS